MPTHATYAFDASTSLVWLDQGSPWAILTAEEIVYNADISDYIRARGE